MKKPLSTSLALSAALVLSACGSGDTGAEQDNSADATVNATADANPFADAEMQMNERMMAAVGVDVGDSWVRKMIEHHQGAIDMSRLMLQQNPSDHVAQMAQDAIDKQTKEIEDLRKLIKEGASKPESAEPFRPVMTSMQQAMMSATGADVEETFMRKMLAHHLGGVAMSDAALENGVSSALRSQLTKTRDGQQKDADMTQAMLNGEPMPASSPAETSAAAPAPRETQAAARPNPAPAARSQPRATPAPAPAKAEDPHAGMNMSGQ